MLAAGGAVLGAARLAERVGVELFGVRHPKMRRGALTARHGGDAVEVGLTFGRHPVLVDLGELGGELVPVGLVDVAVVLRLEAFEFVGDVLEPVHGLCVAHRHGLGTHDCCCCPLSDGADHAPQPNQVGLAAVERSI